MKSTPDKPKVGVLTLLLIAVVGIIAYSAIFAIPVKFIFFDYFNRIGWPTDFSYITTVMIILTIRIMYYASFWTFDKNVSNRKNL